MMDCLDMFFLHSAGGHGRVASTIGHNFDYTPGEGARVAKRNSLIETEAAKEHALAHAQAQAQTQAHHAYTYEQQQAYEAQLAQAEVSLFPFPFVLTRSKCPLLVQYNRQLSQWQAAQGMAPSSQGHYLILLHFDLSI